MSIPVRIRLSLFALVILSILADPAFPQAPAIPQADSGAAKAAQSVRIVFGVRDKKGFPILDLAARDVEVARDKGTQKIETMELVPSASLSVGLMIDASGSRRSELPGGEREPAKRFLQTIVKNGARAYVVVFGERTYIVADLTSDPAPLQAGIETALAVTPRGPTALFQAILRSAQARLYGREGRKALVVITDGEDNSSVDTRAGHEGKRLSMDDLLLELQEHEVSIYGLILPSTGPPIDTRLRRTNRLWKETGGRAIRVQSVADFSTAFDQIAMELQAQYVLTFLPSTPLNEKGLSKLKLRVLRPGVEIGIHSMTIVPAP